MVTKSDIAFLDIAFLEASHAFELGEVPVGAVIVQNSIVIAAAHNMKESLHNPVAHAEVLAIQAAASQLGDWRLNGCTLYCTLEPCVMCVGASLQARLDRIVYGAHDLKWGGCGTVVDLVNEPHFNHRILVEFADHRASAELLRMFFKRARGRKNYDSGFPPSRE